MADLTFRGAPRVVTKKKRRRADTTRGTAMSAKKVLRGGRHKKVDIRGMMDHVIEESKKGRTRAQTWRTAS